jgi:hypothetical protein
MAEVQLIDAVKAENSVSASELIRSGVDINQHDEHGWTPLNWAAGKGSLELVKLLVSQGANLFQVGRDQRTPYMIALAAGHAEVAKYLRQMEDQAEGEKPIRPERKYCKAYYMKDFRGYHKWAENKIVQGDHSQDHRTNGGQVEAQTPTENEIGFLHQDYTVTQSMWHNENVIFSQVTNEWKDYCNAILKFKVPDDLDLIVTAKQ